ncbi:MAG: hypothetical protein K2X90_03435, partial [Candidatus Babeliaceae bacterium]|nr:hypothetical protein [Candidatus Babeliaceae bacterium]
MKNYTYVVCSALMFMLPQLNAQLVSAEDALCRLQELQEVMEHAQDTIDQVLFSQELFALQTFVTESAVCDEQTRDALLHALQVLQEKNSSCRAARIDSPEIHATTVIDPNNYPERDLYLRNLLVTGSLVLNGQQINGNSCDCNLYVLKAGDTMTGDLTFANQHGVVFNDTTTGSVTITAPAIVTTPYTFELPTQPGGVGTVLTADGNNPSQLSWQPVSAIVTSTIQLYGDVIGSASANHVAFVCGVPACDLVNAYSLVLSATSADICGTLVMRDSNCNFSANLITATVTNALLSQTALYVLTANTANFAFTSSSAQSAITSVTSTYFTGQLYGDVVGTQTATRVAFVCGVPACDLVNAYSLVLSATSDNICGTLVMRDSNCNFSANLITATVTNAFLSQTALYAVTANTANFAFTSSSAQSAITSVTSTY